MHQLGETGPIPAQTPPGENPCCLLCSKFGLGLHGGSLSLIKLSLLFEAGTAGLTDNHRDFDQPGFSLIPDILN